MAQWDLNNQKDFAQVTMQNAGNALLALTGGSQQTWDIEESSYGHDGNFVVFHVFKTKQEADGAVPQVSDNEGRRKVYHEYPYVDGGASDDLGRKMTAWDFRVVIFGPRYKSLYQRLKNELNDKRPGTLIHPVLGRVDAVADTWRVLHENTSRNAVMLEIRFVEHTFEFGLNVQLKDVKSRMAESLGYFKKIDDIIIQVNANELLLQGAKNLIATGLAAYKELFSETLAKLNRTFNTSGSDDFPSLLPTNQGGSTVVFPVAQSPSDPFTAVPVDQIEDSDYPALAAQQATDQVITLRESLNTQIDNLADSLEGEGQLEFYDAINTLKESGISAQQILETGLKSSNAKIKDYNVTILMSVREVAFANGLNPDRAVEIELLNPDLESLNYIAPGTVVKVPSV